MQNIEVEVRGIDNYWFAIKNNGQSIIKVYDYTKRLYVNRYKPFTVWKYKNGKRYFVREGVVDVKTSQYYYAWIWHNLDEV